MGVDDISRLVVVGLGNPGSSYETTRHNVGFMVVDELARRHRLSFRPGRGEFWWTEAVIEQCRVACVRPITYMNNSGIAVEEVLGILQCSPADLLIVADDVALPLGTLRIRLRGSDGGHNGIASIIYQLGTEEFPRLRCGIRPEAVPRGDELADFVLSSFSNEEEAAVRTMVDRAVDAVGTAARQGMEAAMNSYNVKTV